MARSTARFTTALAVGLLALAMAGCGGGDDASTTDSASATTPATAVTSVSAGAPGAVQIVDFSFTPAPLTVAAGTSVTWTNGDKFDHSIRSADKTFDSEHLGTDQSFSHTFTTPGTYAYVCGIHNSMTGSIVVAP